MYRTAELQACITSSTTCIQYNTGVRACSTSTSTLNVCFFRMISEYFQEFIVVVEEHDAGLFRKFIAFLFEHRIADFAF